MNWMVRGCMLGCLLMPLTASADGARVYLRNDARLVQTKDGSITTFRCEKMAGERVSVKRWARDCNSLAREEMQRMKREGQLGDIKIGRQPMGTDLVGKELVLSLPINPASDPAHGPVADR